MTVPPSNSRMPRLPQPIGQANLRAATAGIYLRQLADAVFHRVCQAGAAVVLALAALLVAVLVWQAWLAIVTSGSKFFTLTWDPEPSHRKFGALAFIYGTVATSTIAMLIAVPLGVGTATFLSEIAPGWLRRISSFLVEMLAAIPSVVYGFWGLFVLAPALQSITTALGGPNQGGVGILSAGLILSIMIVPYVAAVSYDVCLVVPRSQREASYALGATRWQTIWSVVLPYARPGIIGGCFLALGRALGETMAVTMLIGNRTEISLSPFALGNSIPSVIANEFTEATYDLYLSALVELGLALLLVSVVVNSLARVLIWRMNHQAGAAKPFFGDRMALWRRGAARLPEASQMLDTGNVPGASLGIALSYRRRRIGWTDWLMTGMLGLCLCITVGFLLLILGYLVYEGASSLNWDFFTKLPAPVGEKGGGMANAIYGSFLLVGLATLFAVPIGVLAAIYLAEYRSDRFGPAIRFVGELLSGVPSIVIGIFAYYLVVRPLGHFSGWAGAFALGVMMVPIIMRASEEALHLVPKSLRQASYALGASHSQTVVRVTVPAALPAIVTAVLLAIARVGGETAPLLLTAFNNSHWPTSPNDATPSLPYYIFSYAVSPYDDWHRQGWAAALVLLLIITVLSVAVRLVTAKQRLSASRAD